MNKKKIEAEIIADSINPQGDRITTYLLTFPRFILAEAKTHRIISGLHGEVEVLEDISINSFREGSKNSASSRAIPFEKMVKMVEEDPFIPYAWQKSHVGMQGTEYFQSTCREEFGHLDRAFAGYQEYQNKPSILQLEEEWLEARDNAVQQAKALNYLGITKQLCNRLLEPFMWHTVLITATEWENFFNLRCPKYHYEPENKYFRSKRDFLEYAENAFGSHIYIKDEEWRSINSSQAEIHIQALAEAMWDAMNDSTPKQLKSGEWHLPFSDKINDGELAQVISPNKALIYSNISLQELRLKVCVSRCARISYQTLGDNPKIDYEADLRLHDMLAKSSHWSPFEHCARAMSEDERAYYYKSDGPDSEDFETGWCRNFRGWIQYRHLIENKI